jgi:hypothetical protein
MGTWSLPTNEAETERARAATYMLQSFKKLIYPVVGDDELFDHIDDAIMRIRELAKISKY